MCERETDRKIKRNRECVCERDRQTQIADRVLFAEGPRPFVAVV